MQTCQAYQSCPVCTHSWSSPLSRGVVCDGYRSFLPVDSPGREARVQYAGVFIKKQQTISLILRSLDFTYMHEHTHTCFYQGILMNIATNVVRRNPNTAIQNWSIPVLSWQQRRGLCWDTNMHRSCAIGLDSIGNE